MPSTLKRVITALCLLALPLALAAPVSGKSASPAGASMGSPLGKPGVSQEHIYNPGTLDPQASTLNVRVGDKAPDFTLPSTDGDKVTLSAFEGEKYVVLSFVPAAFTPVCSEQWPSYNLGKPELQEREAVVLGVTVDNIPALYAWTKEMGTCWFPVLSDFYPHGKVAKKYGVLRPEGVTERALFIIDKKGIIRHAEVYDINKLPRLEDLLNKLDEIRAKDAE